MAIGMFLLGSLQLHARDPIFSQKDNFTVYLAGYNKLHFKLPLYDSNLMDRWADDITIYAGDTPLFTYKTGDDDYNKCQALSKGVGSLQIWTTTGYQDVSTSYSKFSVPTPIYKATDEAYVEFDWYAPGDWAGEYIIFAKGQYYWRTGGYYTIGTKEKGSSGTLDIGKVNFTKSEKPEISTVMPSFEENRVGMYSAIWYVASNSVSKVEWRENNSNSWTTLPGTDANGTLYLDAYKPHNNVQIRTTYTLPNGEVTTQASDGVNVNMLHKPINFNARIYNGRGDFKPYARLIWQIDNPEQPDFYSSDIWEVQRNCSGNPNDETQWQSVGMVDFDNDERDKGFTYEDETLLDAFTGNHKIYYRVRRLNTAMWGWNEQSGYAMDSVSFIPAYRSLNGDCKVRSIVDNKVNLSIGPFDDQRTSCVWLTQINGKTYGINGWIWDKNAKFKLLTEFWQRGQLVGTQTTELKDEDLKADSLTIEMTRPCTNYKFKLIEESSSDKFSFVKVVDQYTKDGFTTYNLAYCKRDTTAFDADTLNCYFENNGSAQNLKAENRHTYIHLSWEPGQYEGDYYRIYRKLHGEDGTEYALIRDKVTTYFFDDKAVNPCDDYDYFVETVTTCDTIHTTRTPEVSQSIDKTGTVNGYVRMPDGTGISGARVTATPIGDIPGATAQTVTTDSIGYYSISGLVYQSAKGMAGSYSITVEATDGAKYIASIDQALFNKTTNLVSGVIFTLSQSFKFSGAVYYEGSSIPVVGASFKVDGNLVYNSNGKPLTTDNTGEFVFNVAPGSHAIQVVKENHHFADDGMLIDLDAADGNTKRHNFQKDLNGYYFWDETKVQVKGRVAGGITEGNKPMGEWKTKNIIGSNMEMVLQLDGDNASYIYRDNSNTSLMQKVEENKVTVDDIDHKWTVTRERHRLVIHPDSLTGEFVVDLYPVKWKMTQLSCDGYATLIQSGKTGEVYDLTDSVATAEINYIYHSGVDFTVTQLGQSGQFTYFGQAVYNSTDVMGRKYPVTLAYAKNGATKYTFGHPVFQENYPYVFNIKAGEFFYYNNNRSVEPVVVPITEGTISVRNQMIADNEGSTTLQLDSVGSTNYLFTPNSLTFSSAGADALRSINFTLDYNGAHYDSQPITAYLMGARDIPQGKRYIAGKVPILFDILRDPPGANSSATLSKGSTLSCAMNWEITGALGIGIDVKYTSGSNSFTGTVEKASGAAAGTFLKVSKDDIVNLGIQITGGYKPNYNYSYTTDEDISTSSSPSMVGSKADIYMGFTDQFEISEANAVRTVPKYVYDRMPKGDVYVIKVDTIPAADLGATNDSVCYLIRDKVFNCSDAPGSFFYYTQNYIEKQLLPDLIKQRNALLLPNTMSKDEALALANSKKMPVYLSKVAESDELFGGYEKDSDGKLNPTWEMISPSNYSGATTDEVAQINTTACRWLNFLIQNEKEKVEASDLVKSFDFDGSSSVSYKESFNSSFSKNEYFNYPTGTGSLTAASPDLAPAIKKLFEMLFGKSKNQSGAAANAGGSGFSIEVNPIAKVDLDAGYDQSESHSRSISFSFGTNSCSNLHVDVYRVKSTYSEDSLKAMANKGELYTSFSEDVLKKVSSNQLGSVNMLDKVGELKQYGSFVYRTRGGMTRDPWEEEEVTKYYMPGTVLSEKTVQIDRLKVWAEKQEISNVPMGEPARFTVHFRNDCDYPQRTGRYFNIQNSSSASLKGAKVMCEGAALINPITIEVPPGQTVTKTIEVYAGTAYDNDSIDLDFYSENDVIHGATITLAAHFVPSAGAVNISSPGDKFVLNTFGQYDADRADHYMPIRIDGFDTNFRGFDHIELQYKKSTEGDKDWVNLCSYYADADKMALASGTRKLIGNDGYILDRFYGDKGAVEQTYDVRAVNYCSYGSGFLTRASNIITGTKDTRYPSLFGTPQPINGILGIGDYIRIPFSENIASNDLSKLNNFQVTGRTNTSNIVLSTSLRFQDQFAAASEFERNLADKNFTIDLMIDPDFGTDDMCFFAHGSTKSYVKMYVTPDKHLKAIMKTTEAVDTLTSTEAIDFNGMHHVAMTYDKTTGTVSLFDGNKQIGSKAIEGVYAGRGSLVFGADYLISDDSDDWDFSDSHYDGDMIEFRLWNRILSPSELSKYGQIHLTGYEYGLLDNYPMNEGTGSICEDKGPGKNNVMLGETGHFTKPKGISLKLTDGLRINGRPFYANPYEDFTLMMWVKTTDTDGVIMANGDALHEEDRKDHINLGVANGQLYYRHGGKQLSDLSYVSDGAWHHIAISENNTRNVGNIYVDGLMKESYTVDTLGGISYNDMVLGACPAANDSLKENLYCNIDEVGLFNMVLPEKTIKRYMTETPNGQELGLRGWLSGSVYERQNNNIVRVMPSGVSLKLYKADGIIQEQRDTIIAADVMEKIADRQNYASMNESSPVDNIDFSYVVKDNELVVNLGESDEKLERTNVYVTVKDIPDLRGNLLQSPVMMDLYVYRAPLRWKVKQQRITANYLEGATFDLDIENVSGKSRDYEIKGLPEWLTVSQTTGTLPALGEETLTFTVNKNTNIGSYDEQLYVCDADGIDEPLPITISVVADKPDWKVNDDYANGVSMQIVARVKKQDIIMHDPNDLLVARDSLGEFMGICHINVDNINNANEALAYLTLSTDHFYGNTPQNRYRTPVEFWVFDSSTGNIYTAEAADSVFFSPNTTLGSPAEPLVLNISQWQQIQAVKLNKGWNWMSLYVDPAGSQPVNVAQFLSKIGKWQAGDAFTYLEPVSSGIATRALVYTSEQVSPTEKREYWTNQKRMSDINGHTKYDVYAVSPRTLYVEGQRDMSDVIVRKGWNRIAYNMPYNLSVASAMAGYLDEAKAGDVLKSRDAFAMIAVDAQGNKTWKGNLQYMTSGQGYMLYRNTDDKADSVRFAYPMMAEILADQTASSNALLPVYGRENMSLVALASGIELEEGDTLLASDGNNLRGMAVADADGTFYMTIGSESSLSGAGNDVISFAIVRGNDVVAVATTQIPYADNSIMGTTSVPVSINFDKTASAFSDGDWYDISGIRYKHSPKVPGVYIHNGKKLIIK